MGRGSAHKPRRRRRQNRGAALSEVGYGEGLSPPQPTIGDLGKRREFPEGVLGRALAGHALQNALFARAQILGARPRFGGNCSPVPTYNRAWIILLFHYCTVCCATIYGEIIHSGGTKPCAREKLFRAFPVIRRYR